MYVCKLVVVCPSGKMQKQDFSKTAATEYHNAIFYTYSNDGLMQQIDTFDQQDGKHNGFCVLDNTIDFESPASVILDENNLAQYSGTYH